METRVHGLFRVIDTAKYPVVAARARWVLGSAQMGLARPAEALESYRFALAQFERTGESVNRAAVHSLLASAFTELGDEGSAWRHRAQALRVLAGHSDPERLRIALINAAFASLDAGFARAALLLQNEAVRIAREEGDPERLANSLLNRASILDRTELADPKSDLTAARRESERIEEPSIRQSILADLLAVEGHWWRAGDPARALRALTESIELHRATSRRVMLPGVLRLRAAVLTAQGRLPEAERDLRGAIQLLEEERGSVPDGEQRAGFSDRAGDVFDAMVLLQAERGDAELALEYSERRRARLLLDWLSALPQDADHGDFQLRSWSRPRPLRELLERFPDGMVAVVYEVLPDRLLIWTVRKNSIEQRQVKIGSPEIAERVRRLGRATGGPERSLREAGAALHEILVAPIAGLLRADETVLFIPESPLGSVPFGLLFDPRTGRYLIEDLPFAIAPSLSLFVELARRPGAESLAQADVLVLADPAFDQALFPLDSLPGARQEARSIRALYSRARVVEGEAAGREAFLHGLERSGIVHLAGHALANTKKPFLSSLLLAPRPDRGDSGVLYAREIIGAPRAGADLVVLSACQSGGGAGPPGEGVSGLVWPFLARGVPQVVASTRKVEDRETAALFAAFYRHLADGEPTVAALRRAQLERLIASRSTDSPNFDWAVFQVYGTGQGALKGGKDEHHRAGDLPGIDRIHSKSGGER